MLVTGAGGQLGRYLVETLVHEGHEPRGIGAHAGPGIDRIVDIGNAEQVTKALADLQPEVVLHAAAYTDVDGCERDPDRALLVNRDGSANVARAAQEVGAWML
ncbi:MAG TPA: sugar nucleotide-binding protein, partial [Candidatus Caenarcaniphilales bacterium]|nr:sugar nucleotide-binding protein [Candidatus Caenarcaniphilales bacterium]